MQKHLNLVLGTLFAASLAAGCGDNGSQPPDAAPPPPPPTPDASVPVTPPLNPTVVPVEGGEKLAFGVKEGDLRNYFHRQGPAAVHILTRSGADARIIAAYPANNQGIGVWFLDPGEKNQIWAGADGDTDITTGGNLTAVMREEGEKDSYGVRATVKSDASTLTAYLALLANIRTLRDYGYGLCLENQTQFPELRNETIELFAEENTVRIRREQIGTGGYVMELLIQPGEGTTVSVKDQEVPARANCQANAGAAMEKVVEIKGGESGVTFDMIFLSNDEPLTPIEKADLLTTQPPDSFEFNALAFLSYAEKLQAGSWRFLTYFGRDTLLSVRMLMPGLKTDVVEAALTAVMERINLKADVADPYFDYTIEVGDVSHEEELGDYAGWKNQMDEVAPEAVRDPRYDYKMIDDDFLLAPVLVEYIEKVTAEAATPEEANAKIDAFLARTRPDGMTFKAAIEANLQLVLDRAAPFANDPAAPADKKDKLVSFKNTVPVGQWRDSDMGIAFGRYAFDVNAGLVPAALECAQVLYARFENTAKADEAGDMLAAWQGVEELFLIEEPLATAQADVTSYAQAAGVADTSDQLEGEQGNNYRFYGISLDAEGTPMPVMHTDHGFVMEFINPSDEYLVRVANTISKDYPAGLMSKVGVMVANPALAADDFTVTDPKNLKDPADDVQDVKVRDIFTNSHYHGSVVWSWQQALLASGIRRQLERNDIAAATRTALQEAECKLWDTIDAAEQVRAGELWSWEPNDQGELEYRAFGYNRNDVDESNAAQLWSTVYLVVKRPAACVAPAAAQR